MVSARLKTVWSHYLYLKYSAEANNKMPPSTAPSLPTPGKKFMIIRQELNAHQPGLFTGFDSFSKALSGEGMSSTASDEGPTTKSDAKRRWSLVAKVLSFTSTNTGFAAMGSASIASGSAGKVSVDEQLESARRETAVSRARAFNQLSGPPLPPKPASGATSTSSDESSTGSSPVFEAQQYVFKFILSFCQPIQMPNRVLTKPRLPAPAQAWVTARSRSGSPPPPAPGLPAPTRRVSGLPQSGLINEARNASPLNSPTTASRPSFSSTFARTLSGAIERSSSDQVNVDEMSTGSAGSSGKGSNTPTDERERAPTMEPITLPVQPVGIYGGTAAYIGRALAEWSVVVTECNAFIDRRRDEGVLGLSEVEVPLLGVEGLKRLG
jgi:hypothetical protein